MSMSINTKYEFDRASSTLCGRMASLDLETRKRAADDAAKLIENLPKFLLNSPHCHSELKAMKTFITNVEA
jgi:hypothetical protein